MEDDAERWNARYAGAEPAGPTPPDALIDADLVDAVATSGRALDVACGRGAQAAWAARRGLAVVALDVSPVAVELARRTAEAAGVGEGVDARVVDLDDGLPDGLGRFDLVVCQRFRGPRMYGEFLDHLVPDGLAVVTVLSRAGADSPGPFHAPADELRRAFERPGSVVVHHEIGGGQESIVVRHRPN